MFQTGLYLSLSPYKDAAPSVAAPFAKMGEGKRSLAGGFFCPFRLAGAFQGLGEVHRQASLRRSSPVPLPFAREAA